MSFEAVLCMVRGPAQDGTGHETQNIGIIIRPSGSGTTPSTTNSSPVVTSPALPSVQPPPPHGKPVIVPISAGTMSGIPGRQPTRVVIKGTDQAPKSLMKVGDLPANLVPWANGGYALKQSTSAGPQVMPTQLVFSTPPASTPPNGHSSQTHESLMSPMSPSCSFVGGRQPHSNANQDRACASRSASAPWIAANSDSSTTPDSGIQSVPGTPDTKVLSPPNAGPCCFLEDQSEDQKHCEEDFADMPTLIPADQEEQNEHCPDDSPQMTCQPSTSRAVDDSVESSAHGSECEQPPVPSINITPCMDPSEIADLLAQAMDPDKVKTVTNLMRRKAKQVSKEVLQQSDSRSSSVNGERKRTRPESSASEELRRSEEEGRARTEEDRREESPMPPAKIGRKGRATEPKTAKARKGSTGGKTCGRAIKREIGNGAPDAPEEKLEAKVDVDAGPTVDPEPSTSGTNGSQSTESSSPMNEDVSSGNVDEVFPSTSTAQMTPSVQQYREAVRHLMLERVNELWTRIPADFDKKISLSCERNVAKSRLKRDEKGRKTHENAFPKRIDWEEVLKRCTERKKEEEREKRMRRLEHCLSIKIDPSASVGPASSSPQTRRRTESVGSVGSIGSAIRKRKNEQNEREGLRSDRSTSRASERALGMKRVSEMKGKVRIVSPKVSRSPQRRKIRRIEPKDYEPIATSQSFGACPGWAQPPPASGCGCLRSCASACAYRMIRVQCAQRCAAHGCTNKAFLHPSTSLYVGQIDRSRGESADGAALFSDRRLQKGEFVSEFAGEVISFGEMRRRLRSEYKERKVRAVALSSRLFVDATRKGNLARFAAHSCSPNAHLEIWLVNGRLRAGVFTLREIPEDTPITVSFARRAPSDSLCFCGDDVSGHVVLSARNPELAAAEDISIAEERVVRRESLFLPRNRTAAIEHAVRSSAPVRLQAAERLGKGTATALRHVLRVLARRVRRADGSLPRRFLAGYTRCVRALRSRSVETFCGVVNAWAVEAGVEPLYKLLSARYLNRKREREGDGKEREREEGRDEEKRRKEEVEREAKEEEDKEDKDKQRRRSAVLDGRLDLSYLDADKPIGSYDPDAAWPTGKANEGDEAVRCVCGSLEEDGSMLQCDGCHFWLHNDCIGLGADEAPDEYECHFCSGKISSSRPSTDVLLKTQPDFRLPGCTYYKALVSGWLQVRLNETVYVEKLSGDEHKKALKRSLESVAPPPSKAKTKKKENGKMDGDDDKKGTLAFRQLSRRDARIMRVERLFATPDGKRYLFGFYYARPHETFCDPNKSFHPNEVFATPLYDTLPLDAVAGRCSVLDSEIWVKGRPLIPKFEDKDVLLCECQVSRSQRSFERIHQKNRYFVNQQPYVFEKFAKKKTIRRNFQPFILPISSAIACSSSTSVSSTHSPSVAPRPPPQNKDDRSNSEEKQMSVDRLSRIVDRLAKRKSPSTPS